MKTDVEIAQEAKMQPIKEIAAELGLTEDDLELYGKYKAKLTSEVWQKVKDRGNGKLVLVTAINPTPAGEGKTTTSVGLADALHRMGKKVSVALREPSLGPCFGLKGGAAGGGYAQVVPMEDINLQSALHRRLPRHHHRSQPAGSCHRQPPAAGQRPGSGCAPHRVEAGAGLK